MPKTAASNADDLLNELAGDGLPPMAPGDLPPQKAPSRDAELTVAAPAKPSAVAKANASFSTKVGGKGFRVKVVGEYYADAPSGRGTVAKPYEASFNLPDLDAALSTIKNHLLKPALAKAYADFKKVRTNKIVEAVPLSAETPASNNLAYMAREGLEFHVRHIGAPIDPKDYPETSDLRDAVIDYVQTPDGFEKREALKQADRKKKAALKALNPDLDVA